MTDKQQDLIFKISESPQLKAKYLKKFDEFFEVPITPPEGSSIHVGLDSSEDLAKMMSDYVERKEKQIEYLKLLIWYMLKRGHRGPDVFDKAIRETMKSMGMRVKIK